MRSSPPEAVQWESGSAWQIPTVQTDETGTDCGGSPEVAFIQAVLAELRAQPTLYDASRVFLSGTSMGAAMTLFPRGASRSTTASPR